MKLAVLIYAYHNFITKLICFENINLTYSSTSLVLTFTCIAIFHYFKHRLGHRPIYLLNYSCFKPPSTLRIPCSSFVEHSHILYKDNMKSARFQKRILERGGLGDETSLPNAIHYIPPEPTLKRAHDEAYLVIFSSLDELFEKTRIKPKDIGILVTNCSIFCPTPSLSSMIINKYNMRSSIKSFSLSGMGCSASPISVDLASRLLQTNLNTYALVVSAEIITPNSYLGSKRSMLVPACLFRVGCSAILLSNKHDERKQAKYKLLHLIRTNKGSDDRAHKTVTQEEDDQGYLGISLSKDLMIIAGQALESNITKLGPLVLPMVEKVKYVLNFIARKLLGHEKIKPYIPKFNNAFNHFCIHAGGRAVINEVQTELRLSARQVEASRMTLYRFGNTSSSSIWYELNYIEAKGMMKKGDLVWQIAFGSGFKCNSIVWKSNRNINVELDGFGPWIDSINMYPVNIPLIRKI